MAWGSEFSNYLHNATSFLASFCGHLWTDSLCITTSSHLIGPNHSITQSNTLAIGKTYIYTNNRLQYKSTSNILFWHFGRELFLSAAQGIVYHFTKVKVFLGSDLLQGTSWFVAWTMCALCILCSQISIVVSFICSLLLTIHSCLCFMDEEFIVVIVLYVLCFLPFTRVYALWMKSLL